MPPLYNVIGPIKANGKRRTDGQVELPEAHGAKLVDDGYLVLAGSEFAAPMFDGLLGSPSMPLVNVLPNEDKLLAAELVRITFEASQLSADEWNALPQEDRDGALEDQLDEILFGLQLRELKDEEQQNNRDPGDEHTPPREIATHTQPSDQGRVDRLITGEGGGASAPSSEPHVNSETQSSGPQTEGDASANPPAGESTSADAGNESTVNDGGKMDAPGQLAIPETGAAAAAAPAQKSTAKKVVTKKTASKSSAKKK